MAKEKTTNRRKRRFYKRKGLWIFFMLCVIAGLVGLKIAREKLQPYKDQAAAIDISTIDDVEIPSMILDQKGREIGRMFVENRSKVSLEEVPQKLIDALLAQEDQRFFEHDGVDRIGVARAIYLNLKAGDITQGASTITMQLARNAFDLKSIAVEKGQRGFERKIVEAFLALRIEEKLMDGIAEEYPDEVERKAKMKRIVLEYYLNRIPFGTGYYGIRSAALGYFGKEPMALGIEECASLVACVKNPQEISPLRNIAKNRKARNHVLNRMLAEEMITEAEWMTIGAKPVVVNPKPLRKGKSHLYEIVDDIALEKVGIEAMSRGGFRIYTTIDRDVQERAERSLREQLDRLEGEPSYRNPKRSAYQKETGKGPAYLQGAALMIESRTGDVLAHVGGRDYAHSQYDFIVLGKRPIGTAFLPVIYTAALESGRHPCSTVTDEAMDARAVGIGGTEGILGEWGMEVPHPQYEGRVTSRRALSASKLAASVRLGRDLGLETVAKQAKDFGFKVDDELRNRMLLGWDLVSLPEMVRAYTAISQSGRLPDELRYIKRIENGDGEVVYQAPDSEAESSLEHACDEITAYQIHDMLGQAIKTGNLAADSSSLKRQPFPGVVKTGTTHNFADGWCVGYNGTVTLGIWVGFHQGTSAIHENAFGRTLAFRPWSEVMNVAEKEYPGLALEPPSALTPVRVCSGSGLLATRYCYEPVEDPEKGTSFRYTGHAELLRTDGQKLGLCDLHGKGGIGTNEVLERYGPLAVESREQQHLAVAQILPKTSGLIGEDPYDAELINTQPGAEEISIFVRGPSLLLDTKIIEKGDGGLRLRRPKKIEIETD
jgi:membrane carboxypeptidase/penicillin-binding protein